MMYYAINLGLTGFVMGLILFENTESYLLAGV